MTPREIHAAVLPAQTRPLLPAHERPYEALLIGFATGCLLGSGLRDVMAIVARALPLIAPTLPPSSLRMRGGL